MVPPPEAPAPPPAFSAASAHLAAVAPPERRSGSAWEATYRVLLVHREPAAAWATAPVGVLRLKRGPDQAGTFTLDVLLSLVLPGSQTDATRAVLTCRSDLPGSLLAWERTCRFLAPSTGALSTPARDDCGAVRDGRVVFSPERSTDARPPVIANWTLFDTVRRLRRPLAFTMLEELDAVRPGQSLRPRGEATVTMQGGPVRLRSLLQAGDGILPTTWWLHETGQPLLVLAGLRAYVYDPEAPIAELP